jgi:omega-amidase
MAAEITIALIQADLIWKDKKNNLSNIEQLIQSIHQQADIIVLPEMFTTGFCVDDMSLAEDENGETVLWMKKLAAEKQAAICGSILFTEANKYFNRLLFVEADGKITSFYDKHHLFTLVGENQLLTKGTRKVVLEYKGWKIQPLICYDLRFPAWCQNDENSDIQLFVANWPEKRIHHWLPLLKARSIENQCYVAGVNRTGTDNSGNTHNGCSVVYDFKGAEIVRTEQQNGIEIVKLSKTELEKHKERYPFWKDRQI